MKNYPHFYIFFAFLFTITIACGDDPIIINDVIVVNYKESVKVPLANLNFQFSEVIEESRCPLEVNCFQAGRAKVELKVSPILPAESMDTLTINLEVLGLSDKAGTSDTLENYIITLLEVSPYPNFESPAPFEEKVVKLRVKNL